MNTLDPTSAPDGFSLVLNDLIEALGPNEQLDRRREIDSTKDALEASFRNFVAAAWGHVDAQPYVPTWHLDAVADHLQAVHAGQIQRLIICQPPGTGKSMLASVLFPPWCWGPAGRPSLRVVAISHAGQTQAPAVKDATKMRRLIESPWYQSYWGDRFQLTSDQNQKTYYVNNHHGYRASSGIVGSTGQRAELMILDDVLKITDRLNATALQQFQDDWPALSSRLTGQSASVVLIMQRLNTEDPAGFFLKRQVEEGWVLLRLPRLFEPEHRCRVFLPGADRPFFEDPRTYEDEPLTRDCPAFTPLARVLGERARSGEWVWASQEQQRPTPLKGGIIKLAWIHRWAKFPVVGQAQLPNAFDQLIQSWDCTFKKGPTNSWVVGQVWGLRGASVYLLDQRRGHWDLPETMRELVQLSEAWPGCGAKLVEDKANGPAVIQMLGNVVPGLIAVSVEGSKPERMMAVAPFFESSNVFLPEDTYAEWVPEYIAELTLFPGGRTLDQGDATSQGVWRLLSGLASSKEGDKFATYNANVPLAPFSVPVAPTVVHDDSRSSRPPDRGVLSGVSGGFDLDALRRGFGQR